MLSEKLCFILFIFSHSGIRRSQGSRGGVAGNTQYRAHTAPFVALLSFQNGGADSVIPPEKEAFQDFISQLLASTLLMRTEKEGRATN